MLAELSTPVDPKNRGPRFVWLILLLACLAFWAVFIVAIFSGCAGGTGSSLKGKNFKYESATAKISAEDLDVSIDQDLLARRGDLTLGLTTTAYHVALDAQEKAAFVKAGEMVRDLGGKGLALWLSGGSSEAAAFLSTLAKKSIELQQAPATEAAQ